MKVVGIVPKIAKRDASDARIPQEAQIRCRGPARGVALPRRSGMLGSARVLVAVFGVVLLASCVGLWRVISTNHAARRYLQPTREDARPLRASDLDPERWALVSPLVTLQRVVHGEIGALQRRSSTPMAASLAVNAEVQHWLDAPSSPRVSPELAKVLEILSMQVQDLWEGGNWGCRGTIEGDALMSRLQQLEALLVEAQSRVANAHMPYRR